MEILRAAGLFAVTNVDDTVLPALFFAGRPAVARAPGRWGHVVLPVVLIGIGVLVLLG
ncbi:hypothetical protein [Saccharothrix sp. Mg75]|uniref:hypothetical protein n=1 Tax=Saccharothrix sp. Mg75 TaxID=3445357 RepID=UPI003EEB670C